MLGSVLAGETSGSDAHTLGRIGRTWTECPGSDRESFLENLRSGQGRGAGEDGRLGPLARDVYSIVFSYYGTLLGRGRVKFLPGEKWPGAVFSLATLPAHLVGLPMLATCWNLLMKRAGLARIHSEIRNLEMEPPQPVMPSEADLLPETEA